jgi:hypothetical protein
MSLLEQHLEWCRLQNNELKLWLERDPEAKEHLFWSGCMSICIGALLRDGLSNFSFNISNLSYARIAYDKAIFRGIK